MSSSSLVLSPVIEVPPPIVVVDEQQAELERRRFMPTYNIGNVDLTNHDYEDDTIEEDEEHVMRESVRQNAQRVEDVELTISEAVGDDVARIPEADGLLRVAIEEVGFALFEPGDPIRNGRMICSYAFPNYFDIENCTGFSLQAIHSTHLPPDADDKVRVLQHLLHDYQQFIVETENTREYYHKEINRQMKRIFR